MMEVIAAYDGPVYIRINRNDLPVYTDEATKFEIGKIYPIVDGKDAVIFATGVMVSKSVEAAELLKKDGISVQVVNVSTLKPLKKAELLKYTAGKKAIITAEEATRIGGLGQEIAAHLIGDINVPFKQIAIDDEFGQSAHNYEELLTEYGISTAHIVDAVRGLLKVRK
jgi:transketolase